LSLFCYLNIFLDYPHWSQSSTFLPDRQTPTTRSRGSIADSVSAFNLRRDSQSCYDLQRLAYKPATPKRFIQLDTDSYKPINYWNDWFGRPGNGAPLHTPYKQNLNYMLEPKRSQYHEYEAFRDTYGDSFEFKRFDSNHHNKYELNPR
jgi:hypothetical protein